MMRQDTSNLSCMMRRKSCLEISTRSAGTTAITEAERGRSSNMPISPKSSPWPRIDRITSRPSSSLTTTLRLPVSTR